jgi:hypothetical protein
LLLRPLPLLLGLLALGLPTLLTLLPLLLGLLTLLTLLLLLLSHDSSPRVNPRAFRDGTVLILHGRAFASTIGSLARFYLRQRQPPRQYLPS